MSSLAHPHLSTPGTSPVPTPTSSGGGRDVSHWIPVGVAAQRSGKSRNVIGGLVRRGKLRALRVPHVRNGHKYLVHWPTAEPFLRAYVPALRWTRQSGKWSGPPSPETIARFNEVWEKFVRGECEPLGYARPGAGKVRVA